MDPRKAQATLVQFSDFLLTRQETIISDWMEKVHADGRMQTVERLSTPDLKSHLPQLFQSLKCLLRSPADLGAHTEADQNARTHGHQRFGQGYRLDELLREIARLRGVIIAHTLEFDEQTADFHGTVKRVAIERLHRFFDDMICDSAAQFVRDQRSGLSEDLNRARADASEQRHEATKDRETARQDVRRLEAVDASRLQLLQLVAEELRNSTTAVHLVVQQGQNEPAATTQRELEARLTNAIGHLETLLQDLLDCSSQAGAH